MISYILRRLLYMIPMMIIISMVSFALIQLPPGDAITYYEMRLREQGQSDVAMEMLDKMRERYGLDKPLPVQYWTWIKGFPQGDFGMSMAYQGLSVASIISERLLITIIVSVAALIISWGLAIPIGIYSATHKYSKSDYALSFFAFVGMAIPHFMLAMLLMFFWVFVLGNTSVGGLFSPEYQEAPWSWAKFLDLLIHLPIPVIVLGLATLAGTMRVMRGNLMDVLDQQYVMTARAKGLKERKVVFKHAVRIAINPLISRLGLELPGLLSGSIIVSIVLSLPMLGPVFQRALSGQDMYLAGTILLMLSWTLLLGNLVADILLAWADPRIRLD
jgi:peptide/nickel transport system permease protein